MSLNKIGYEVEGTANLYVMPSGTDPTIGEEIFRSARWKKLAAGFAETGALLLLVARSDAPGLAELAEQIDGVVLVRDAELAGAPSALVLARVPAPTPTLKIPLHRISARAADWRKHRWLYPAAGAIALLLIAGFGLAFMLGRGRRRRSLRTAAVARQRHGAGGVTAAPPPSLLLAARRRRRSTSLLRQMSMTPPPRRHSQSNC